MTSSTLYPTTFRDWELRSGTTVLKARRTHAGGIISCLVGGVECIIANDHGRGIQESMSFDRNVFGSPTADNPTGHGSQDDSTGSTSESVPRQIYLSPDGTKVRTVVQVARWFGPGDVGAAPGVVDTPSQVIFDKTITASYGGRAGLFQVLLDIIIPVNVTIQAYKLMVTEALCLYFNTAGPASMSVAEDWDYATETLSAIPGGEMSALGPTFRAARPIISDAGGNRCGGIYSITKSSDASGLATDGNAPALLNRAGDYRVTDHTPTTILNPDVQVAWNYAGGVPAGTYSFEVYLPISTKAISLANFAWLKVNKPSP